MPAIINSSNQIELQGSDSGWSRAKIAMPAAPTGTTNAIYVMRYWMDTFPSNTATSFTATFDPAFYAGFSFDSSHPANLTNTGTGSGAGRFITEYSDFWPYAAYPFSQLDRAWFDSSDSTAEYRDFGILGRNYSYLTTGNGDEVFFDPITVSKSASEMPFTVPISPAIGATATYLYQVWSDESDETVYSRYWLNNDSVDLDAFDIEADIDPSDPYAAFPITDFRSRTGDELNDDVTTGTNWRPSSGVMGFPTYFMARYPMDEQKMVIDYVGVHYSEATVT